MSLAAVASQQSTALAAATAAANAAAAAASAAASSASSATNAATANPLVALSSNFNDFLQMLMTQLQNQDPTSPMDTNEFTTELVQFSGVEQQINTNSQPDAAYPAHPGRRDDAGHVDDRQGGHRAVESDRTAERQRTLNFTDPTAGPVAIAVTNSHGHQLYGTTLNATAGQNTWTWNGTNNAGTSCLTARTTSRWWAPMPPARRPRCRSR
jgi:flagellar basal-body rod modification protein FlgD